MNFQEKKSIENTLTPQTEEQQPFGQTEFREISFTKTGYYDYAETLRQVVEIEIDSHGNVIKSSYIPKNTGNLDNKIKLQYKYAITYREM